MAPFTWAGSAGMVLNFEADVDIACDMTTSTFLGVLRAGDTVWVVTLLKNSLKSYRDEVPAGEA